MRPGRAAEAPGGKVESSFLRDPDGNTVQLDPRIA